MVRHSFPLYLALHILLLEECQAHSSLPIAVTADQADFTDGVRFHDVQSGDSARSNITQYWRMVAS